VDTNRQITLEDYTTKCEAAAGLDDWGDPRGLEALERICDSARRTAPPEASLVQLDGRVMTAGVRRLQMVADRKRYPQIARQRIEGPLIVVGLPRSGTTILHALLAQDPASRSPLLWEVSRPSPPPRAESFRTDPRIDLAKAEVERMDPQFRAMHAIGAELPEECNVIMSSSFMSLSFWAAAGLSHYVDWIMNEADVSFAYDVHREMLQHLQAFNPRARWTLKSPPHLLWMDRLLEAYPDARIVMTHRDPAVTLASNASLIANRRGGSAYVDLKAVGREQLDIWGEGLRRTMRYRQTGGREAQFCDSHYVDFMRDPIGAVARIYDHFGIELTAEAEAAMRAFLDSNQKDKHGKHHYTAEQFGLDPATLRRELAEYIDTYRIKVAA